MTPETYDSGVDWQANLLRADRQSLPLIIGGQHQGRYDFPPNVKVGYLGTRRPERITLYPTGVNLYACIAFSGGGAHYLLGAVIDDPTRSPMLVCVAEHAADDHGIYANNEGWATEVVIGVEPGTPVPELILLADAQGHCAFGNSTRVEIVIGPATAPEAVRAKASKRIVSHPRLSGPATETGGGSRAQADFVYRTPDDLRYPVRCVPTRVPVEATKLPGRLVDDGKLRERKGYGSRAPTVSRLDAATGDDYVEASRYGSAVYTTDLVPGGEVKVVAQAATGPKRGRR